MPHPRRTIRMYTSSFRASSQLGLRNLIALPFPPAPQQTTMAIKDNLLLSNRVCGHRNQL